MLDLRGIPCPINFVRTKLKLDQMQPNEELRVLLDDGEPIESVSKSIVEEGHRIVAQTQNIDGHWLLVVRCKAV